MATPILEGEKGVWLTKQAGPKELEEHLGSRTCFSLCVGAGEVTLNREQASLVVAKLLIELDPVSPGVDKYPPRPSCARCRRGEGDAGEICGQDKLCGGCRMLLARRWHLRAFASEVGPQPYSDRVPPWKWAAVSKFGGWGYASLNGCWYSYEEDEALGREGEEVSNASCD